jgi:DNA-binding NarL/FixJ family response regulator
METMTNQSINILLADDHEIFRDGFTSLIDKCTHVHLIACATNGEQLVHLTEVYTPDVVLTDIVMPVMNGMEATKIITQKFPQVGVIGFSMFNDVHLLKDMLLAGAMGFLIKNSRKEEVVAAINSVSKGQPYFCADTSVKLAKSNSGRQFAGNTDDLFTEREKTLILYVCRGLTNREIAKKMFLSTRTIEKNRERLMVKAKVSNAMKLYSFATASKIIFVDDEGEVHLVEPNHLGWLSVA